MGPFLTSSAREVQDREQLGDIYIYIGIYIYIYKYIYIYIKLIIT